MASIFAAGRHANVDSEGYFFRSYNFDVRTTMTVDVKPNKMKHILIFLLVSALDIVFELNSNLVFL